MPLLDRAAERVGDGKGRRGVANVEQTLRGAAATAATLKPKHRLISASYDADVAPSLSPSQSASQFCIGRTPRHRWESQAATELELGYEFGSQTTFAATASRRADVGRQNKTETGKRQRRRRRQRQRRRRRRRILKSNQ